MLNITSVCFPLCPFHHSNWCSCCTRLFTWTHAGIKGCWYGTTRWFSPRGTANETRLNAAELLHLACINSVEPSETSQQPLICCNQSNLNSWFICALAVLDITKHNTPLLFILGSHCERTGKICNKLQNFTLSSPVTFNSHNQKHSTTLHLRQLWPYMKKDSHNKSVSSLPWIEKYEKKKGKRCKGISKKKKN